MTGDYMTDDIGDGYDLIIAVGTLNFAKHAIDSVMEKLYSALRVDLHLIYYSKKAGNSCRL